MPGSRPRINILFRRSNGPRWRDWPATWPGKRTLCSSSNLCSSSCSWAVRGSANRRCSTPWPPAPSRRLRFNGQRRATRSCITTSPSSPIASTPCSNIAVWPPHDRPALVQKIIVDTPDLDSNDLANRDKLHRLLPVADVVLYVGSQEKYHDKLGWDLFLQQRKRRAFAFVLNKWDRCQHPGASGMRPDQDLLKDLESQGFQSPLLFRTCAQYWVDHPWQANGDLVPQLERRRWKGSSSWTSSTGSNRGSIVSRSRRSRRVA